jgi:hypothetical protein
MFGVFITTIMGLGHTSADASDGDALDDNYLVTDSDSEHPRAAFKRLETSRHTEIYSSPAPRCDVFVSLG